MSIFFANSTDAAAAVQRKLSPDASSVEFSIGDGANDDMTLADCLQVIEICEDRLFGYLPDRYRKLLRTVDGESLTEFSREGQTTFRTSLVPVVEDSARLYVDYPVNRGWDVRSVDDEADQNAYSWTIDNATGVVEITGSPSGTSLAEGQRVYIEYDHTAALTRFPWLRDIVVTWTAIEISRRYLYFRNQDAVDRWTSWEIDRNLYLKELRKSERGIDEIDNIKLVYLDQDDIRRDFNYLKILRMT